MKGFAAIVFCGAIASCSHDIESGSDAVQSKVQETYEKAFVTRFGTPASTQTWGFGTSAKANTRAANTEHNQWAAVDNIYKLLVPPALTPGQIQRVKVYFQYNRYLTYEDPHLTDFFVQQVYEGSTDPGALSTEVYTAGNGTRVVAGDHMDKLTVGVAETHVNDFNSADCGESTVLNNGTKQNDYVPDGTTHQDKITLMLGESTEYVGFWCSEGSVQHNDCCALAGADVIDAWATSDEVKAWAQANNIDLGSTVVDGWDRSFVGLDYEQVSPEDLFRQKYVWPDGNRSEVKVWDFCSDTNNTHKVMLNGQLVDASTVPNDQLFFPNGEPVKWVDDNTNMYLGQNLGTNQNTFNKQENGVKYYDLDALYDCINQGAYPKLNNMEFIKGLGGRDYVFSDWIVTLTPAKRFDIEEEVDEIVVLAEDLTIDDARPDFDFNDVVFKVTQYKSGAKSGQVWVTLLAAGGTLPLTVDGHEVHEEFANANPDKTILVTTMINTAKNGHTAYKTASFQISNPSGSNIQEIANNIPVVVTKFGEQILLVAPTGGVPSKIAVKTDFLTDPGRGWCDERQDIDEKYNVQGTPLFKSYVRGELDDNWYTLITTKGN